MSTTQSHMTYMHVGVLTVPFDKSHSEANLKYIYVSFKIKFQSNQTFDIWFDSIFEIFIKILFH